MIGTTVMPTSPCFLYQVCGEIRLKRYIICIEQTYADGIKRFIAYFGKQHPSPCRK